MIEHAFHKSRLLVLVAVAAAALSAVLLYFASLSALAHIFIELFQNMPRSSDDGKILAVKLLKVLDLLLIAISFQIIAVGLYRLFITPVHKEQSAFLSALNIKNFHDLKTTIIQVSVVIMVILFLEQAVEHGATLMTLYFGAAVALVIFAAIYASKNME